MTKVLTKFGVLTVAAGLFAVILVLSEQRAFADDPMAVEEVSVSELRATENDDLWLRPPPRVSLFDESDIYRMAQPVIRLVGPGVPVEGRRLWLSVRPRSSAGAWLRARIRW